LYSLLSFLNIISVIKSMSMAWKWRVVSTEEKIKEYRIVEGNPEGMRQNWKTWDYMGG